MLGEFLHGLASRQLINGPAHIVRLLHQWILDFLNANAANVTFDQRTLGLGVETVEVARPIVLTVLAEPYGPYPNRV